MSTMIESTKLLFKSWEKAVNVAVKNPSHLNIQEAIKAKEIFSLKALAVSEKDGTEEEEALCLQFLTSINEKESDLRDKLGELTPLLENKDLIPQNSQNSSAAPTIKVNSELKPPLLSFEYKPEEFDVWKTRYSSYFETSGMDKATPKQQQMYLRNCLDNDVILEISRHLDGETQVYGSSTSPGIMEKIGEVFLLRYPILTQRVALFKARQQKDEPSLDCINRLIITSRQCDISKGITYEDFMSAKIIHALNDETLKKELQKEKDLTIEKILTISRRFSCEEHSNANVKKMAFNQKPSGNSKSSGKKKNFSKNQKAAFSNSKSEKSSCYRCGETSHNTNNCPEDPSKLKCTSCDKNGHTSKACRSKLKKEINTIFINKINGSEDDHLDIEIWTGDQEAVIISSLPDTGSQCNVFSKEFAFTQLRLYNSIDKSRKFNVKSAQGLKMKCLGAVKQKISLEEINLNVEFLVIDGVTSDVIIGRETLRKLEVIPKDFPKRIKPVDVKTVLVNGKPNQEEELKKEILEAYPEVFEPSGQLKPMEGPPMKIHLRTDIPIVPSKCPPTRAIPVHLEDKAMEELDKYEAMGVIEKVTHPTDWVSPAFFTGKPGGGVRLVTDYTKLNKFVKRPDHPFPSPEEVLSWIPGDSKFFAKLDAKSGYWQIPLDDESKDLTTFITTKGRYRYTRAPMGLSSSSDEFCRRTDEALSGLKLKKIVDDCILASPSIRNLKEKLHEVSKRCRDKGITLSKSKFEVGTSVNFAGYTISANGVSADKEKIRAISDFPTPKNVKDIRSFLGLANQLAEFVFELASASNPLRKLLKKNVPFTWTEEEEKSFAKVKEILTSTPVLNLFDVKKETILLTDASNLYGLGYALVQIDPKDPKKKFNLIRCGSRSVSDTESRYAPIELEALAIEWAIRRSKIYLLGSNFKVQTDHKPLVGIFNRRDTENLRLQRIMEKVDNYTFTVEYVKGKTHYIADALSRAPIDKPTDEDLAIVNTIESSLILDISKILNVNNISRDLLFENLIDHAKSDKDYQAIITSLKNGVYAKNLPPHHPGRKISSHWDKLSLKDGLIIVDGRRIFIPSGARPELLKELHGSHSGYGKTLNLARRLYFWIGMVNDIKKVIDQCEECQTLRPSNPQKKNQKSFAGGEYPMEAVSTDLFDALGSKYLVTMDRYSGYIFVDKLTQISTSDITGILNRIFTEYGFPERLRSDGGPQFRSVFKDFCKKNAIVHEKSSPYYARSNGHAESGVKIAKYLLRKTKGNKERFRQALFDWKNTPKDNGPSPSEKMFGRILRKKLPIYRERTSERIETKPSKFKVGMKVRIQNPHTKLWDKTATLTSQRPSGSWNYQEPNGTTGVRNEVYLKPYKGPVQFEDTPVSESRKEVETVPRRSPRNLPVKRYGK